MTESGKRWARGPQEEVRDQAMAMAMKRKEEYLGARVPRWLKDKVIERARDTGVPVSILIRNILEEAFREGRDGAQTRTSRGAETGAETHLIEARHRFSTVIGWEQIKLNRTMSCSGCGKRIDAGARVTLGLVAPGEEHVILCGLCEESL